MTTHPWKAGHPAQRKRPTATACCLCTRVAVTPAGAEHPLCELHKRLTKEVVERAAARRKGYEILAHRLAPN